jgi:hypothetical protein
MRVVAAMVVAGEEVAPAVPELTPDTATPVDPPDRAPGATRS